MPKILPALLLVVLASQPIAANAATYWVSPTGSASASGSDSLSNAKSLADVNSRVVAGDIVRFKSGTYSSPIQPNANGSAGSRIRYYGFPSDPTAVTVTNIRFGWNGSNSRGDYATANGFTVSGSMIGCDEVAGLYAVGDSIANCRIPNAGGGFNFRTKNSVMDACVFGNGSITSTGQSHFIDMYNANNVYAAGNRITNCTFTLTINTTASQGDVHVLGMFRTHSNVFFNNTFNVTVNSCYGYFFPVEMYRSYYNSFQSNRFNLAMNATPGGTHAIWGYRDSSSYNRFVANTVTTTGPGMMSLGLSQAGSFVSTTNHTYLGGNVFKLNAVPVTGGIYWQNGSRSDTLEFNTVAVNGGAALYLEPGGDFNNTIVRHNTFFSNNATVFTLNTASNTSGSRLVSNVFYSTSANSGSSPTVSVPSGVGLDSLGLVFSRGGSASNAIRYNGTNGAPGSGGNYGQSGKAVWNTPMFVDSSYATLNTALRAGSPAQNASFQDGFAGALGVATADLVRPAPIGTLTAPASTDTSVTLAWTAVGDDSLTGTATSYEVRYSTSAITAGNFASATLASGPPAPAAPGSPQTMTVKGLAASTTYFFAIVTRDDGGNASALSNVASKSTAAGDTIPPAAVNDLSPN